jgi:hypothetical protein
VEAAFRVNGVEQLDVTESNKLERMIGLYQELLRLLIPK